MRLSDLTMDLGGMGRLTAGQSEAAKRIERHRKEIEYEENAAFEMPLRLMSAERKAEYGYDDEQELELLKIELRKKEAKLAAQSKAKPQHKPDPKSEARVQRLAASELNRAQRRWG